MELGDQALGPAPPPPPPPAPPPQPPPRPTVRFETLPPLPPETLPPPVSQANEALPLPPPPVAAAATSQLASRNLLAPPVPPVAPLVQAFAPPKPDLSRTLQVFGEDCEDASRAIENSATLGARSTSTMRRNPEQREVYVQDVRDGSRFRSVSHRHVRQALERQGKGEGAFDGKGNDSLNGTMATTLSELPPASLACLDPDASTLAVLDEMDNEIGELLVGAWHCEAMFACVAFISQTLLAGLSLALAFLVLGSGQDEQFLELTSALARPYLAGVMLALAEVSAMGSLLSLFRVHQWMLHIWGTSATEDEAAAGNESAASAGNVLRRGLFAAFHSAASISMVMVCVLAGRSGKALEANPQLLEGPSPGMLTAQGFLGPFTFLLALPEVSRFISVSPVGVFSK